MDSTGEMQKKLFQAIDESDNTYTMDDWNMEYIVEGQEVSNLPKMGVDFVNESDNQDPDWETAGSSGFDLRANEDITIKTCNPSESYSKNQKNWELVSTGLYFDIPNNFEIQVRPRSGLAAKHGITVLNTPGTIDSDYTGQIKVILINHGCSDFHIKKGDRIAQAVFATVTAKDMLQLNKVDSIDKVTERGAGGFGHTGTK